jgi:hypothetical protein
MVPSTNRRLYLSQIAGKAEAALTIPLRAQAVMGLGRYYSSVAILLRGSAINIDLGSGLRRLVDCTYGEAGSVALLWLTLDHAWAPGPACERWRWGLPLAHGGLLSGGQRAEFGSLAKIKNGCGARRGGPFSRAAKQCGAIGWEECRSGSLFEPGDGEARVLSRVLSRFLDLPLSS